MLDSIVRIRQGQEREEDDDDRPHVVIGERTPSCVAASLCTTAYIREGRVFNPNTKYRG